MNNIIFYFNAIKLKDIEVFGKKYVKQITHKTTYNYQYTIYT